MDSFVKLINTKATADNCSRFQPLIKAKWLDLHTVNNRSFLWSHSQRPYQLHKYSIIKTWMLITVNFSMQIGIIQWTFRSFLLRLSTAVYLNAPQTLTKNNTRGRTKHSTTLSALSHLIKWCQMLSKALPQIEQGKSISLSPFVPFIWVTM